MDIFKTLFPSCDDMDAGNRIKTIGLTAMILLSMIVYGFVGFLNSYALFALILCLVTLVYLGSRVLSISGGVVTVETRRAFCFNGKPDLRHLWILALLATVSGFVKGSWRMGNLIDLVVIFCCVMVILDAPEQPGAYRMGMRLIAGFSLFYAASIWIQVFLPGVYDVYVDALINGSGETINRFASYYTGFTTSPGHTATYIVAGMFVFALEFRKQKIRTAVVEAFLLISLFGTGMRMPTLAMGLGLMFLLFMQTPPARRKKLFLALVGCGCAVLVIVVLFQKQFRTIPLINRVFVSVESLLNGEDISSGRSKLYRHAVDLFLQKPLFGIGWGNFRHTVAGLITKNRNFEVHNIFLQLLCETGIFGFIGFVIPMMVSLVRSIRFYEQLLASEPRTAWTQLMGFSCMFQIYFLMFSMTDNLLYYAGEQILYLISCSVPAAYLTSMKKRNSDGAG